MEGICVRCGKVRGVMLEFEVPADSALAKELAQAEKRPPRKERVSWCLKCFLNRR